MKNNPVELSKVEKKEGRFVLQISAQQLSKIQFAADLALLQSGKATSADLAAILARILNRLDLIE